MKRFNERWQECVRQVRRSRRERVSAGSEAEIGLPANWRRLVRAGGSGVADEEAGLWEWYGARGLAAASVVLALCLLFAVKGPREAPSLRPGVEDAVAEVLWSL